MTSLGTFKKEIYEIKPMYKPNSEWRSIDYFRAMELARLKGHSLDDIPEVGSIEVFHNYLMRRRYE